MGRSAAETASVLSRITQNAGRVLNGATDTTQAAGSASLAAGELAELQTIVSSFKA